MTLVLEKSPLPMKMDSEGVVRVAETRVTLDTLVAAFKNGGTPEQIAHDFPVLDLADVYAVITFYLHQRDPVENYLAEQRMKGDRIRQEMQTRFDPQGIRDRLLKRREAKDCSNASVSGG